FVFVCVNVSVSVGVAGFGVRVGFRGGNGGGGRLLGAGTRCDEAVANVLDQEGKENASHANGARRSLVLKLAQALVCQIKLGVGEKVDKGRADDYPRAKLFNADKHDGGREEAGVLLK